MPDSNPGNPAETLNFERFQVETPPPYGPFTHRFKFGLKVVIDGKQWGVLASAPTNISEQTWKVMENDIRRHVEQVRANPI